MVAKACEPVAVQWRRYYRFPSVPLWVLTFFSLVLPRVNRKPQAWLILIPLGVAMIAREVLVRTMSLPASSEVTFDFFVVTGAVSWAAVWLLGHWLAACRRIPAILLALAIPAAIASLSYFGYFGFAVTENLNWLATIYGTCVVCVVSATTIAGLSCRGHDRPWWLLLWFGLWLTVIGPAMLFFLQLGLILAKIEEPATPLVVLLGVMLVGLFLAVRCICSACRTWCWLSIPRSIASGWRANLGLREVEWENAPGGKGRWGDSSRPGTPLSTAPTSKAVDTGDVVGRWQFYLDRLSCAVLIEFRPDGTFAQTILPNQGGAKNCPGGTWRLEGPRIHLDGYVTATEEATNEARTWWVIDTTSGPALYGGDGIEPSGCFCLQRSR